MAVSKSLIKATALAGHDAAGIIVRVNDELCEEADAGMFVTLLVIPASYVFRRGNVEDALPASAIAVLATMYVGMLAGSMIRLRSDFVEGPKLVYFLVLVVWLGDAGAYYVGMKFGRRKLSPRISPKKTVEGLIGGITVSVITAIVIPRMKQSPTITTDANASF